VSQSHEALFLGDRFFQTGDVPGHFVSLPDDLKKIMHKTSTSTQSYFEMLSLELRLGLFDLFYSLAEGFVDRVPLIGQILDHLFEESVDVTSQLARAVDLFRGSLDVNRGELLPLFRGDVSTIT
jgi:hypothetical protein